MYHVLFEQNIILLLHSVPVKFGTRGLKVFIGWMVVGFVSLHTLGRSRLVENAGFLVANSFNLV